MTERTERIQIKHIYFHAVLVRGQQNLRLYSTPYLLQPGADPRGGGRNQGNPPIKC